MHEFNPMFGVLNPSYGGFLSIIILEILEIFKFYFKVGIFIVYEVYFLKKDAFYSNI